MAWINWWQVARLREYEAISEAADEFMHGELYLPRVCFMYDDRPRKGVSMAKDKVAPVKKQTKKAAKGGKKKGK